MQNFQIEVTETLSRLIDIEADNESEARDIVRQMYKDEALVLDSDDYTGVTFTVI